MKDWFKARNIWGAGIMSLSDEEAGRFVKALWNYTMNGAQPDLSGAERGVMAIALMTLSADDEAATNLSAVRAAAGSKGGVQKVANLANASFATQNEANPSNCFNKNKNKNKDKEIEKESKKEKEDRFARFWSEYPRKEAKQTALKAFEKINPDDSLLDAMIENIHKSKLSAQWQEDGGRFIPHPATWLNQRRWEDEPPKPQEQKPRKDAYDQRPNEEPDMDTVPEWLLKYKEEHAS